jgi:dephospho-CoA kinase
MRIVITGGIASGKSTILQMLQEKGVPTLSADALARDILWNSDVQNRLMRRFDVDSPISPVVLKELISQGDENRRAINGIMHPVIATEIAASNAIAFEVPLLFEACMQTMFDAVWVASCSRQIQIQRLKERYGNLDQFDQFSWQLDSKIGIAFADSVIRTDLSETQTNESLLQEAKRWDLPLVVSQ